jgi:hypothetical protein
MSLRIKEYISIGIYVLIENNNIIGLYKTYLDAENALMLLSYDMVEI